MSMFHESLREILEDVYTFLHVTLHSEVLSTKALTSKEDLSMKLIAINKDYPQLQLTFSSKIENSFHSPPQTPNSALPPYVDMKGSTSVNDLKPSVQNYELCTNSESVNDLEDNPYASTPQANDSNFPPVAAVNTNEFEKFGYLEKRGKERLKGLIKSTQQRWYAIKDGILYYYDKPTDRIQKGVIPLYGYEAHQVQTKDKKNQFCFELVCPGRRTYQFVTFSLKDMEQWISAVERTGDSRTSSGNNQPTDLSCNDTYELVEEKDNEDRPNSKEEHGDTNEKNNSSNNDSRILEYKNLYVGLWDCLSNDNDELDFHQGDVIHILSKEYDNYSWWIGELNGKVGFVPKSYLMEAYKSF